MRAVVQTAYGGPEVLQVREISTPEPKENEIRVRVRAAAVTMGDCEIRGFKIAASIWLPMRLAHGITKPRGNKVLGTDFAGDVDAVGARVGRYHVGDRLFGTTGFRMSTHAEYVCVPADGGDGALGIIPPTVTYEEAASAPLGGMMAGEFLRKGQITPGKRVLIIGAGGSIGTFAVQVAKNAGAHVTAVDNGHKVDLLQALGADRVIDYTRERVTEGAERYDVIYSVAGEDSYDSLMHLLNEGGIYLLANLRLAHLLRGRWADDGRKVRLVMQSESPEKMEQLRRDLEEGRLKAVVDRSYLLDEAPEAHRYIELGLKRGGIVLTP